MPGRTCTVNRRNRCQYAAMCLRRLPKMLSWGYTEAAKGEPMPSTRRALPVSTPEPLARLRDAMTTLQRDAEKLLRRTQSRASTLLGRDRRRAQQSLFDQAVKLRKNLEKQTERATRDLERRAERFRTAVEDEVSRRLKTLLHRLDLPSRHEVQRLTTRIGDLEHRLRASRSRRPTRGSARGRRRSRS